VRRALPTEQWVTYGACVTGDTGHVFSGLLIAINFVALLFASYQAFKARDISSEFSESKSLGLALFMWVQVLLVAAPSFFLLDVENVTVRYFLFTGLIFVLSESMMVVIFVPLALAIKEYNENPDDEGNHAGSVPATGASRRTSGRRTSGRRTSGPTDRGEMAGISMPAGSNGDTQPQEQNDENAHNV